MRIPVRSYENELGGLLRRIPTECKQKEGYSLQGGMQWKPAHRRVIHQRGGYGYDHDCLQDLVRQSLSRQRGVTDAATYEKVSISPALPLM